MSLSCGVDSCDTGQGVRKGQAGLSTQYTQSHSSQPPPPSHLWCSCGWHVLAHQLITHKVLPLHKPLRPRQNPVHRDGVMVVKRKTVLNVSYSEPLFSTRGRSSTLLIATNECTCRQAHPLRNLLVNGGCWHAHQLSHTLHGCKAKGHVLPEVPFGGKAQHTSENRQSQLWFKPRVTRSPDSLELHSCAQPLAMPHCTTRPDQRASLCTYLDLRSGSQQPLLSCTVGWYRPLVVGWLIDV